MAIRVRYRPGFGRLAMTISMPVPFNPAFSVSVRIRAPRNDDAGRFVAQLAVGQYCTGVRDSIQVVDLALGHLKALARLQDHAECRTINLGTGVGYSVLYMVCAFEQASGKPVPYQVAPRRAGDIASCYADPAQAWTTLGWRAERGPDAMCADTWRWQKN